jgi:ribosomal protein S12 methylthiotransferase
MKRGYTAIEYKRTIRKLRAVRPGISLSTDFIVGFPGETEDDFKQLLDWLEEAQLDRVGCFQYSAVDGAKANDLPDPVADAVKQERYERFMEVQQRISSARLQAKIGEEIDVLIDEVNEDEAIGRSKADAPEIDGKVYLQFPEGLQPGDVVTVTVEDADDYDLYA